MSSPITENKKRKKKIKKTMSLSNDSYGDFEKHLMQSENVEAVVQQPENDSETSYLNITIQIKAPISPPKAKEFVDSFLERLHSASKSYLDDTDDIQVPRPIKVENFDDVFNTGKSNISKDEIFIPRPIKVENLGDVFDQNCQTALPRLPNNSEQNSTTNAIICDKNDQIIKGISPIRSEKVKILQNEVLVSGNCNFKYENDVIDRRFIELDDAIRQEINSIQNFMVFTASDTAASDIELPVKKKCKRRRKTKRANEWSDSPDNKSDTPVLTVFELAQKDTIADSGRKEKNENIEEDSTENETNTNKNQSLDIFAINEPQTQTLDKVFELLGQNDTSTDSGRKENNRKKTKGDSLESESCTDKNQSLDIPEAKKSENQMQDEDEVFKLLTQKDTSIDSGRKKKNKQKRSDNSLNNESSTDKNQSLDILVAKKSENNMPDEDEVLEFLAQKDTSADTARKENNKKNSKGDSTKNKANTNNNPSLDTLAINEPENQMLDEVFELLGRKDTSTDSGRKEKNRKKTKEDSMESESCTEKIQSLYILDTKKSENQMLDEDEVFELLTQKDSTSTDQVEIPGRKEKDKKKTKEDFIESETCTVKSPNLDIQAVKASENQMPDEDEVLTQKDTSTDFERKQINKKTKQDSTENESCPDKNQSLDMIATKKSDHEMPDEVFELLGQKDTTADSGGKNKNKTTAKNDYLENESSKNQSVDILATKTRENLISVEDKMSELFTEKGTDSSRDDINTKKASGASSKSEGSTDKNQSDDLFELLKQNDTSVKQKNPTTKKAISPQHNIDSVVKEKTTNVPKDKITQNQQIAKETKKQTTMRSKNEDSKRTNGKILFKNTQEMVDDVISSFALSNDTNVEKKSKIETLPPVEDAQKEEDEDINIAKLVALNEGNAKPKTTDITSPKPKKPRAPRKSTKKQPNDNLRQATLDEVMHIPESIKNFFYGGNKVQTPIITKIETPKPIKRNAKRKLDTSAVDMDLSKIANDKSIDKFLESLGVSDQPCDDVLIKPPEKYKKIRRTPAKGRSVQKMNHLEETESFFSDATSTMSITDLFDFSDREMSPASKRKKRKDSEAALEHIVQTPPRIRRYSRGERSITDYFIETPKRGTNEKCIDEDMLKSRSEFFDDFDVSSSINLSASNNKSPGEANDKNQCGDGDDADVSLKQKNAKRPEDIQGNHEIPKEGEVLDQEKNGIPQVANAFEMLKQARTNSKLKGANKQIEKTSKDGHMKRKNGKILVESDSQELAGDVVSTIGPGGTFGKIHGATKKRKTTKNGASVSPGKSPTEKFDAGEAKDKDRSDGADVSLKEKNAAKRPKDIIRRNHEDTKEGGVPEASSDKEKNGSSRPQVANGTELLKLAGTNGKLKGAKKEVEKTSNGKILVESEDQELGEDVISTIGSIGATKKLETAKKGAHCRIEKPEVISLVEPAIKQNKKKRKTPTKDTTKTVVNGVLPEDKSNFDDFLHGDDDTTFKMEANSSSDYSLRMSLLHASDFEDFDDQSPKRSTSKNSDLKSEAGLLHHESDISDGESLMPQPVKRKLKSGGRRRSSTRPKKTRLMVKDVPDDEAGSREELVLNFLERNALLKLDDEEDSGGDDDGESGDRRTSNAERSYDSSDSEVEELSDELTDKFTQVVRNVRRKVARVSKTYKKLSTLSVKVDWDVPPAHMLQSKMACLNQRAYYARCDELDVKLRTGHFLAREDWLIRHNFRRFCERHGLEVDPKPFLTNTYEKKPLMRQRERRKFVQHLARGLDDRRLYCVFKRFQALMRNTNCGKFTAEEDAVILTYCKKFPRDSNRFWTLSHILNRPAKALYRRFVLLQTEKRKKLNLTVKYKKFIRRLLRITKAGTVDELKNTVIKKKHWSAMSAEYHGFPWWKLKLFWLQWLYPRLYSTEPINREEILRYVINKFYDDNETDQRAIDWARLAERFENCTPPFLRTMFRNIVNLRVPVEERRNFRSVIKYLRPIVEDKTFKEPFIYPVSYP